jgi:5-(aminomethyl)-3-furanmethanol phosphate kinase
MSPDAVLKIGGSLSRGTGLVALCSEVGRLGEKHSLLVVPGGGDFSEQVREADRRYRLDDTAAHRMALLAMDQYGYLLNQLIDGSRLTTDLSGARESAESGRVAILLPSAPVFQSDPLPHSWQVTSDTIAAWVSRSANCNRLVLLKDVDGLLGSDGLIKEMTVEQLAEHAGGVDEYLSNFLESASLEVWIINGLCPERLSELLGTGRTSGTRIAPAY